MRPKTPSSFGATLPQDAALPQRDPLALVRTLHSRLVPHVQPDDIQTLSDAVSRAATIPDGQRIEFTNYVNELLRATNLTLEVKIGRHLIRPLRFFCYPISIRIKVLSSER